MLTMIGGGILLRRSQLIAPQLLNAFYVCMGTLLLLAALRFYRAFARYSETPKEKQQNEACGG